MTMTLARACALGLLAAGISSPAHAYVRSTTQSNVNTAWGNPSLELEIYTADPPQFVSAENVRQALAQAAAVWSRPAVSCTDVAFSITEVPVDFAPADFDKHNRIGFRRGTTRDDWKKIPCVVTAKQACAPYPTGAIAITTVTSNSNTGEILDADMEINAVNQKFADLGDDGMLRPDLVKVHDLQNTLTHELGHLLGFDHNCYDPAANLRGAPFDDQGKEAPRCATAPADIQSATMFNQAFEREVSKRTLAADDLLAVCQVYPVGYQNPYGNAEDDQGGCSFAPAPRPGSAFALAGFLLGVLAAFRVGRARRRRR